VIIEELVKRRSVLAYLPLPIEKEKMERIMEAGRLAPTARNAQQWKIIIVDDPVLKTQLVDAASPHQSFLKQAPVLLAACGIDTSYVMKCGHPAYIIDLAIVLDHISLQAVREGLGTCWIGSFFQSGIKKILEIPDSVQLVELMSLGYTAAIPHPTARKPVTEFYGYNKW